MPDLDEFGGQNQIRTKKTENLKVFEFWAFQKNLHMPSREKYIFHMLFRAFHDTPRYGGPPYKYIVGTFSMTKLI